MAQALGAGFGSRSICSSHHGTARVSTMVFLVLGVVLAGVRGVQGQGEVTCSASMAVSPAIRDIDNTAYLDTIVTETTFVVEVKVMNGAIQPGAGGVQSYIEAGTRFCISLSEYSEDGSSDLDKVLSTRQAHFVGSNFDTALTDDDKSWCEGCDRADAACAIYTTEATQTYAPYVPTLAVFTGGLIMANLTDDFLYEDGDTTVCVQDRVTIWAQTASNAMKIDTTTSSCSDEEAGGQGSTSIPVACPTTTATSSTESSTSQTSTSRTSTTATHTSQSSTKTATSTSQTSSTATSTSLTSTTVTHTSQTSTTATSTKTASSTSQTSLTNTSTSRTSTTASSTSQTSLTNTSTSRTTFTTLTSTTDTSSTSNTVTTATGTTSETTGSETTETTTVTLPCQMACCEEMRYYMRTVDKIKDAVFGHLIEAGIVIDEKPTCPVDTQYYGSPSAGDGAGGDGSPSPAMDATTTEGKNAASTTGGSGSTGPAWSTSPASDGTTAECECATTTTTTTTPACECIPVATDGDGTTTGDGAGTTTATTTSCDSLAYWVSDLGCPDAESGGSYESPDATVFTRCCAMDGSSCTHPKKCKEGKEATYAEAMEMCTDLGMRLCTKDELDEGVCCGTGGKCDDARIWTSTAECGDDSSGRRLAVTKVDNVTGGARTNTQGIVTSVSSSKDDTTTKRNGAPATNVDDTTRARATPTSGREPLLTPPVILSLVLFYIFNLLTSIGATFIIRKKCTPRTESVRCIMDKPGRSGSVQEAVNEGNDRHLQIL